MLALNEDLVIHLPPVALSVAVKTPRHRQRICTAPTAGQRQAIHRALVSDWRSWIRAWFLTLCKMFEEYRWWCVPSVHKSLGQASRISYPASLDGLCNLCGAYPH